MQDKNPVYIFRFYFCLIWACGCAKTTLSENLRRCMRGNQLWELFLSLQHLMTS